MVYACISHPTCRKYIAVCTMKRLGFSTSPMSQLYRGITLILHELVSMQWPLHYVSAVERISLICARGSGIWIQVHSMCACTYCCAETSIMVIKASLVPRPLPSFPSLAVQYCKRRKAGRGLKTRLDRGFNAKSPPLLHAGSS